MNRWRKTDELHRSSVAGLELLFLDLALFSTAQNQNSVSFEPVRLKYNRTCLKTAFESIEKTAITA